MGNVNQKQAGIAAAATGGHGMHPSTKANNRILSIALAVCLVLGLTLVAPGPVAVQAADMKIGAGGDLHVGDTVYFGSAATTYTTDDTTPGMGWVVLDVDNNEAWLFAENVLYESGNILYKPFQSSGKPPEADYENQWSYSELCEWLNGDFYSAAFTAGEQAAVTPHTYTIERNVNSTEDDSLTHGIDNHQSELFLLDLADVQNGGVAEDCSGASANWWLRSPGGEKNDGNYIDPGRFVAYVLTTGEIKERGEYVSNHYGVRPALRLDLSSVIFTSDADGSSKSGGAGASLTEALPPTGAVKLTVVDSSLSMSNINANSVGNNTVNFSFDANGTYNSLSAIVQKADGSISHYGRLQNNSGTSSVVVPAGLDSADKLLVFVERINGVNETDYASEPVALVPALEITSQPNNISVNDGGAAAFAVSASASNLKYQWQVSGDNGSSFANIDDAESESYSIAATDTTMNGNQYRVVVTDELQREVVSHAATLTVNPTTAQQYSITIDSMANGSVAVKDGLTRAEQGAEIHLIVTPDHGYRLQSGTLQYNSTPITGTRFTMPGENVTIYARFEPVPSTPSVSVDSLTIPKGETRDFVVYLGTGGDAADSATVASNDPSVAAVNPDTVTADGTTVTVTGVQKGNTAISLGWSGGSQDNTAGTVSVEVTDGSGGGDPGPGDSTHRVTVTANPSNGGNPVATPTDATPTQIVTVKANPHAGWEFAGWSSDPSVAFDDDLSPSTTFAMPDGAVTITASYTKSGDGGDPGPTDPENPGGGSSGSRSTSRDRSSGNRSTPDRQAAKTTLPASAFKWEGRTLTIDHDSVSFLGLLSVQWDGTTLTRGTDYGVYQGSVIVRFGEDFMAAQSSGDHTIRVEFLGHTGETTVTVGEIGLTTDEPNNNLYDNDTHNPNTGGYPDGSYPATDNPNTGDGRGIWFALLLGSLGGIVLVKLRPRLEVK